MGKKMFVYFSYRIGNRHINYNVELSDVASFICVVKFVDFNYLICFDLVFFQEIEMEFPPKSHACESCRSVSIQASNCQVCSNQEICILCGNKVLSVILPKDMLIEGNLPKNTCQCFFFSENDVPEDANCAREPKTELSTIQIYNSKNESLHVKEAKSSIGGSSGISNEFYVDSRAKSKTPEFIHSSIGNNSSLDKLSSIQNFTHRGNTPLNRGEDIKINSKPVKNCSSSDYALSVDELFSRRNFTGLGNTTSPSSGIDSKINSKTRESYSSSGYALSLDKLSPDQNFTDHETTTSQSFGEDSKTISKTGKSYSSSGYALSLGEQSSYQNMTDKRNDTSPSSGEDSNIRSHTEKKEINITNENEGNRDNYEHKNLNDGYKESDQKLMKNQLCEEESKNFEYVKITGSKKEQYEKSLSTELQKFTLRNNIIGFSNTRPPFPRPFPQPYQPYRSTAMNLQRPYPQMYPQPYQQPFRPYSNSAMNMPVALTNVPGRFSVVSRPQLSALYYQKPRNEGGLSKKSLSETVEVNSETNRIKKMERIENWLHEVESFPPDEEPSKSGWSGAENYGTPPTFSETSTDDRSSAEISEEETRRQMSTRRPPRVYKKYIPR